MLFQTYNIVLYSYFKSCTEVFRPYAYFLLKLGFAKNFWSDHNSWNFHATKFFFNFRDLKRVLKLAKSALYTLFTFSNFFLKIKPVGGHNSLL